MNVKSIRKDFPIFNSEKPFVYLDSASTTQKPQIVIDALTSYYNSYAANVHRALYTIGEKATDEYEGVRLKIKQFLNVPDTHSVIFTRSTTESLNLVAYAWGLKNLCKHDSVLVSEMEHHSNLVPWQLATEKTGASIKYIPLTDDSLLNLESLDSYFSSDTKLVSVCHQSNVFGTVNPIDQIIDAAKNIGTITVIDGAQAVPHMNVDITKLDCDFYAFSGHKMVGPTGVGVLIGRTKLLEEMDPFMGGGEMINTVTIEKSTWNDVPWKFEAGTPNIAQVIGLGAAIDYLQSVGVDTIHEHEKELLTYGLQLLSQNKDITLYGNSTDRGAVIPFNVKNIHPHDLAKFLDTDGICIRAGHHCSQPIMNHLGVTATARASFYLYNTKNDIEELAESIEKTALIFT
ncbi:MAG: cysteine desulfurase [Candidatus Marinimicrobia bacterium]|nr:cysteine desulfurase [Candidatus Neomarinimicrobiota bacterium]MBT3763742.1 cysteine desulfurase [Candidatus Neomarinimicrobiota bacterium]MBT4067123.1 cysteine desulfurase [Candidatus Neomarinimicrobiota bacterium]MBT4271047.1 cysteine desulfurase [Candidatus Neomarinimicrobiota bacterium]MBT4372423.1 cysteine desulfurase [Candidatus Neomarinimicrobiota bacterium]